MTQPQQFSGLRRLCLLAGALGFVVPGFTFFTDLAPPASPVVPLVVAAAAAVVFAVSVVKQPAGPDDARPSEVTRTEITRSVRLIGIAFLIALAYVILFDCTTIGPPAVVTEGREVCQTGFLLSGLTPAAASFCATSPERCTREELMMAFAAFPGCRTELIWRRYMIHAAGLLLITTYTASCLLWTLAFARLGRAIDASTNDASVTMRGSLATVAFSLSLLPWLIMSGCAARPFRQGHALYAERVANLEEKIEELDARDASVQPAEASTDKH